MPKVVHSQEINFTKLDEKSSRKVLAYGDDLMAVEVSFAQGGRGAEHFHQHAQISYILRGTFRFSFGDAEALVKTGDCIYIEPNQVHQVSCLEDGIVLDVFTPKRDDFLLESGNYR